MFKLIAILIFVGAFIYLYGFDEWLEDDSKKKSSKSKDNFYQQPTGVFFNDTQNNCTNHFDNNL